MILNIRRKWVLMEVSCWSSAMHRWQKHDLNLRPLLLKCTSLLLSGYGINVAITISSQSLVTYCWFSSTWYIPTKCLTLANPIFWSHRGGPKCLIAVKLCLNSICTGRRWKIHTLLKWQRGATQIKGLYAALDWDYFISRQYLHLYSHETQKAKGCLRLGWH